MESLVIEDNVITITRDELSNVLFHIDNEVEKILINFDEVVIDIFNIKNVLILLIHINDTINTLYPNNESKRARIISSITQQKFIENFIHLFQPKQRFTF